MSKWKLKRRLSAEGRRYSDKHTERRTTTNGGRRAEDLTRVETMDVAAEVETEDAAVIEAERAVVVPVLEPQATEPSPDDRDQQIVVLTEHLTTAKTTVEGLITRVSVALAAVDTVIRHVQTDRTMPADDYHDLLREKLSLQTDLRFAHRQLEQYGEAHRLLKQKQDAAHEGDEELAEQLALLRSRLDAASKFAVANQELRNQVETLQSQAASKQNALAAQAEEIGHLMSDKRTLEQRLNNVREELRAVQKRFEQVGNLEEQERVSELEQLVRSLEEKVSAERANVTSLTQKLNLQTYQLKKARQTFEGEKRAIEQDFAVDLEEAKEKAQEEIDGLREELERVRSQAERDMQTLHDHQAPLEQEVSRLRHEAGLLKEKLEVQRVQAAIKLERVLRETASPELATFDSTVQRKLAGVFFGALYYYDEAQELRNRKLTPPQVRKLDRWFREVGLSLDRWILLLNQVPPHRYHLLIVQIITGWVRQATPEEAELIGQDLIELLYGWQLIPERGHPIDLTRVTLELVDRMVKEVPKEYLKTAQA